MLHQVYAPTGTHGQEQRLHLQQDLREEIRAQGTDQVTLMGDWNMNPTQVPLLMQLSLDHGFRVPPLMTAQGEQCAGT